MGVPFLRAGFVAVVGYAQEFRLIVIIFPTAIFPVSERITKL
jgi:hypothetical protein